MEEKKSREQLRDEVHKCLEQAVNTGVPPSKREVQGIPSCDILNSKVSDYRDICMFAGPTLNIEEENGIIIKYPSCNFKKEEKSYIL
ncbi:hypothetical protein J4414_01840 [Candidatus Woesearchaeota archaeon]|nr:hypothetical protein [Candidatus Woesearchaeota archaeon]